MIEIKNLRYGKPQNPWDICVDRANKVLGNPFYMANEAQRGAVCEKYADWFRQNSQSNATFIAELDRLAGIYKEYGRLSLYCWCSPKRCHAETIREYLLVGAN